MSNDPKAIRHEYEAHGAEGYYRARGSDYRNPHEPQVRRSLEIAVRDWKPDLSRVLDLAAGSGEVTLALRELGAGQIDAIDPFTYEAYERRTGQAAGRQTFEQIAAGALAGRDFSLIVCSFALHLVAPSRLPQLAWQLSRISSQWLVLTPHKRPQICESWGWRLGQEMVVERVRSRLYQAPTAGGAADSKSQSF